MHRYPSTALIVLTVLTAMLVSAIPASAQSPSVDPRMTSARTEINARFEENRGQVIDDSGNPRSDILFTARMRGMRVYVLRDRISYVFVRRSPTDSMSANDIAESLFGFSDEPDRTPPAPRSSSQVYRLDVVFDGASAAMQAEGTDAFADVAHYYLAHCRDGVGDVHSFGTVTLRDLYPSIDMVLRVADSSIKYEFVVRPGGDPSRIRMRYDGVSSVDLDASGNLHVRTEAGDLLDGAPISVLGDGEKDREVEIPTRFVVRANDVSFAVATFDRTRTLVIDPSITWSTYIGNDGTEYGLRDHGTSPIAICTNGDVVFGAMTEGTTYPTSIGAFQYSATGGNGDAVLVRIRASGARAWATFIGGTAKEECHSIALDAADNVAIGGLTESNNFPVSTGADRTTFSNGECFIVKFDSTGARLWGTYVGGTGWEGKGTIASDSTGGVIIFGSTSSTGIATTGAYQTTLPTTVNTPQFLARYSSTGARQWATYFGSGVPMGVESNASVGIIVCGRAGDVLPVTTNAYQTTVAGTFDGFVARFGLDGRLKWSTFIGGGNDDVAVDVTADARGNITTAGWTLSSNFPVTTGAFQTTYGGPADGTVTSFDSSGALRWSTFIGGIYGDQFGDIDADPSGEVVVAGITLSSDYPTTTDRFMGPTPSSTDGVISWFDSSGGLRWSTYISGNGTEYLNGVAVRRPFIAVGGLSWFGGYPTTTNAMQRTFGGSVDHVVTRICLMGPSVTSSGPLVLCPGDSVTLSASNGYDSYLWSNGATSREIVVRDTGSYRVTATSTFDCSGQSNTVRVAMHRRNRPTVTPSAALRFCAGDSVRLVGTSGFRRYRWSNGDTTAAITVRATGTYRLSTLDSNGCRDSTDGIAVTVVPRPITTVIEPAGPIRLCAGDSITLAVQSPVAGERLVWSNGAVGPSIRVGTAGTYFVKATNADGCVGAADSVRVTTTPRPVARINAIGDPAMCPGDSLELQAGGLYATYAWSTGDSTRSIYARSAGQFMLTVRDTNGCSASTSISVTVRDAPVAIIFAGGPLQFCSGGEVLLQAGGHQNAVWSNGMQGPIVIVRDSGFYWTDITDVWGCRARSDTVRVDVFAKPNVDITGPLSLCPNSEATYAVRADDGLVYEWSLELGDGVILSGRDASDAHVRWGSSGGRLRVIARNPATGCSDTAIVDVGISDDVRPAVAVTGSLRLCPDDSVSLDAGPGYARYRWSNGDTTRRTIARSAGRHAVYVETAEGCAGSSDTVVVSQGVAPVPVVSANGATTLCKGSSATLATGRFATYLWSNGERTSTITVRDAGTYSVRVLDSNGCEGVSEALTIAVVDPPAVAIEGPAGGCAASELTYCASDSSLNSFVWTVVGGTIITGDGTRCIGVRWSSGAIGSVAVRAKERLAGCTAVSDPFSVDLSAGLQLSIRIVGDSAPCEGEMITLDAGGGFASYRWSSGATSRTIDVSTSGTYSVDVADATGCAGSASTTLTFMPKPSLSIVPSGPQSICRGDSIVLAAPDGYTAYSWSNGDTSRTTIVRDRGTYTVTVVSMNGCSGVSSAVDVSVVEPPTAAITRSGDSLIASTDAASPVYQWLRDGVVDPDASGQIHVAQIAGQYSVRITSREGCTGESAPIAFAPSSNVVSFAVDTVSARVGERLLLTLRAHAGDSTLATDSVAVHLQFEPHSLFLHRVFDNAPYSVSQSSAGEVLLTRGAGTISSGIVARFELEGLVTAVPVNPFRIARALVAGVDSVGTDDGLVLLTGCVLASGSAFGRVVAIQSVAPNPASNALVVRYTGPPGAILRLSLRNIAGREVAATSLTATGNADMARIELTAIAAGYYTVELRDRAERAAVPIVVVK